jgi:hypothetical protein
MSKFTFTEEQRFSRHFVIPFVIFVTLFTVAPLGWGIIQQIIFGKPYGDHSLTDVSLLISGCLSFIVVLLVDWLLIKAKLTTEINSETIRYRFYPFILRDRFIYWNEIEKSYVRKYKPILEYGGWGIRYGIGGNGRAFNMKGRYGLQLELKNGKKLLIGTQKPEEITELLDTLGKNTEKSQ